MYALDPFEEGYRLFTENKMQEAIPLLYQASLQSGTPPSVFLHLGLAYQQTGKYADAISTFMRGTSASGTDRKALFFNAGNVYYRQELYQDAEIMYSRSIEVDSAYAPAYLNRANARMKLARFTEAENDYSYYLTLDPASWQRDSINQLLALIRAERKAREDESVRLEAERLTKEAEERAAADRYQQLLDAISSSLKSVDAASTLSAGSEDILLYDEVSELE